MKTKIKVSTFTILILIVGFYAASFAQDNLELKRRLVQAIEETSNYACNILLDKDGQSRCEYNIIDGKWYPYEPAWHTGQIIFALVDAYKITKNEKYIQNAKRAGDWWCSLQITDNPKLKGMVKAIHMDGIDYIVFATISDGTAGLFNLYKATGIEKYATIPTSAGEWMLENMYVPEHGVFYDMVDPITGEVQKEFSRFWPDKKEQTLFDVARPNNEGSLFKDMYEFTNNEKYKQVFIELCESLVEKQGPEGLWMEFTPNNKEENSVHPRFNLWYAESLLEGFKLTGDKRYLEAARKTIKTFQKFQLKDGTIFYKNFLNGSRNENSITGSAVAFMGILYIKMIETGFGDEFKESLEKSFDWVMNNRFAADHPDKNLAGGILNSRVKIKKGQVFLLQRDIGTAFGIRFLTDYYHYKFDK